MTGDYTDDAPLAALVGTEAAPWPTRWRCAPLDLNMAEEGVLIRELRKLGLTRDNAEDYMAEKLAMTAVMIERRDNPSIPLSAWATLKSGSIDIIKPTDPEDDEDPTSAT